ncbi:C40 family peptidase [Marinactinospora thermotolerans]|uniref:C40 family peptidase n=1 Tax=Marinactinospora thermotolerans TaxID=531310 RepID=UPI001F1B29D9|nr:C40 family peptidase [Marinactinospora thermotolerans]
MSITSLAPTLSVAVVAVLFGLLPAAPALADRHIGPPVHAPEEAPTGGTPVTGQVERPVSAEAGGPAHSTVVEPDGGALSHPGQTGAEPPERPLGFTESTEPAPVGEVGAVPAPDQVALVPVDRPVGTVFPDSAFGSDPFPPPGAEPEPEPEPEPDLGAQALEHAKSKIGTPYRYGATGPDSFDCSGLVQWAYQQVGIEIGRTTYDQYEEGTAVSRTDLRPGDLVFFYSGPSHVGMYAGDGEMIHAPSSGKDVQIVSMSGYFDDHYQGARRVV